jgi:hypothetical protein
MMNENSNYILWYRKAEEPWKEFELPSETIIGSSDNCDLTIQEIQAASEHVQLSIKRENIWITDLETTNGTLLDAQALLPKTPQKIIPGQVFSIGSYFFMITEPDMVDENEDGIPDILQTEEDEKPGFFERILDILPGGRIRIIALVGIWVLVVGLAVGVFFLYKYRQQQASIVITPIVTPDSAQPDENPDPTPTFGPASIPTVLQDATGIEIVAPGEGDINIGPIALSAENFDLSNLFNLQLSIGELLNLGTEITGDNVGFIYRYVGLKIDDNVHTVDMTYIGSEVENQVGGVDYPEWGNDGVIPVEFEWKPSVYFITDGTNSEMAMLRPVTYGLSGEDAVYAVNGIFTFYDSKDTRQATIDFNANGEMLRATLYKTGTGGLVMEPHEFNPRSGDEFTILLERFEFEEEKESSGAIIEAAESALPFNIGDILDTYSDSEQIPISYGTGTFVQYEGGTLTFDNQKLMWYSDDDYSGDFIVGFIVEDLDGQYTAAYVPVLIDPGDILGN